MCLCEIALAYYPFWGADENIFFPMLLTERENINKQLCSTSDTSVFTEKTLLNISLLSPLPKVECLFIFCFGREQYYINFSSSLFRKNPLQRWLWEPLQKKNVFCVWRYFSILYDCLDFVFVIENESFIFFSLNRCWFYKKHWIPILHLISLVDTTMQKSWAIPHFFMLSYEK